MPHPAFHALLAEAERSAAEIEQAAERIAARIAWARQLIADMMAAQERVTRAWGRTFDSLPDDLSDEEVDALPDPPEQAELDKLLEQLEAWRDHDRWPRHLYWSL